MPSQGDTYPNLSRWVTGAGVSEIGYCPHAKSFVRALDEGGMVWHGQPGYPSLDAALTDAEKGIGRWMEGELGLAENP